VSHYPANSIPVGERDSIGSHSSECGRRPDASIIINTDAVNLPSDTIPMFGVGILPRLVITPSYGTNNTLTLGQVAFGEFRSVRRSAHQSGSDTLRLHEAFLEGDPDFTFHPLVGTDTLILPRLTLDWRRCLFRPLQAPYRIAI